MTPEELDANLNEINSCKENCLCDPLTGGCKAKIPVPEQQEFNGYCGNSICGHPSHYGHVVRDPDHVVKIKSDGGGSAYYEIPPGAKEIQDLVEFKNMNFAVGNIFKAAYRLGQKAGNDLEYDLRKIIWYANRELKRLEQQEKQ